MPINLESNPTYDGQAVPDATDWASTALTAAGTGIVSGCTVTALGSPAMAVQVSTGIIQVAGTVASVAGTTSISISTASTSDRRDIILALNTGAVTVVEGTPCGTANWSRTSGTLPPVKPAIDPGTVFLAEVYVAANVTSITNAAITANTTVCATPVALLDTIFTGSGEVIVGTGAGSSSLLAAGSVATVLTSTGYGAVPAWQPPPSTAVTAAGVEATFGAAGQVYVGTGSGTGTQLSVGSVGTVLTSNGAASVPSWQPPTGGGASAGVSSFNTRSGAVTLGAADVEGTFGAAGQLFMGTGSGTGELLAPSSQAGLFLTSAGTGQNLVWQSASVASGVSTIYASDHSQWFAQTNASVNVHAGIGVYVDALGADPTGVADSTAAFNAALQAVSAASVGYVRLGVGTYLIGTLNTTTTTTTGNLSASCPATFVMGSTTGWYNGNGTFDVVTSNGVGVVEYTGVTGASVTGCRYAVLGGTGSISSGASVTAGVGNFIHQQGLIGPGSELTTINYQGAGVGLFVADPVFAASVSNAGPLRGFSLVGTSAGYAGLVFGNLNYARTQDINISGFTNSNSGAGFYFAGGGG